MLIGCIDLESIPSQVLPKECRPEFNPDDVKLGNLKDPYKIEAKMAEEKKKFQESLNKKMSTDPALCQVCTFVGYQYNTKISEAETKQVIQYPPKDEYEVIYEAWDFIKYCYNEKIPLVTFNGKGFDLPVLFFRAMLLDIPVDQGMYQNFMDKWKVTKHHYDLMQVFCGPHPEKGKTFDFYLRLFGVGEKTIDMDASKVYEKWLNDEYDIIKAYCEDDVSNLCKLFIRIAPWIIIHD